MKTDCKASLTLEICLCSKCASVYYELPDYNIQRSNIWQDVLEECTICHNNNGFDFKIWELSTVRRKKSHHCGGDQK